MHVHIRNILLIAIALTFTLSLVPMAQAEPVECEILSFSFTFGGQRKYAKIDNEGNPGIITIVAPEGTDLRTQALTPQIELPLGAVIDPLADEPQDFSMLVRYTVSILACEKPVTKEYIVRVAESKAAYTPVIQSFAVDGHEGVVNELNKTILLELPAGTNLRALAPKIAHSGADIQPPANAKQDFTQPVTYEIAMENGRVHRYTVHIHVTTEG